MNKYVLLYGTNGYTGELIAQKMLRQGLPIMLGGRSTPAVGQLATGLGLPHRIFHLTNAETLTTALHDIAVFVNCAGPFDQPRELRLLGQRELFRRPPLGNGQAVEQPGQGERRREGRPAWRGSLVFLLPLHNAERSLGWLRLESQR